jgi:hypothetical protein
MAELTIGEDVYLVNKLHGKDQFHVFRRIAPLIKSIGEGLTSLPSDAADKSFDELAEKDLLGMMGPLANALAGLSDETLNYVIDKCLARVQIRVLDGRFVAVQPSPGRFQFEDKMDMGTILQLVLAVMQESNLTSFFTAAPPSASRVEGFQ